MKVVLLEASHIDIMADSVRGMEDRQGCMCTFICSSDSHILRTWMHYNPDKYLVKEVAIGSVMPTFRPPETMENFIYIRVSLKNCSYDDLLKLAKANPNIISSHLTTEGLLHSLENLNLHMVPDTNNYAIVIKPDDSLTGPERTWLALWNDFDWQYLEHSDPEHWVKHERLIETNTKIGSTMGISAKRMRELRLPMYHTA